jgi:hypothetical protein
VATRVSSSASARLSDHSTYAHCIAMKQSNDDREMSEVEVGEIRARCVAATPGPWTAFIEGRDHESGSDCIRTGDGAQADNDIELIGASAADYDFIAHAREDVPRLLTEIARLKALLRRTDG